MDTKIGNDVIVDSIENRMVYGSNQHRCTTTLNQSGRFNYRLITCNKYFILIFINMATYPVVNKETGETKDVVMSIHVWDQWKEDNPDWERYYTPENAPGVGEVGEWKDKLIGC